MARTTLLLNSILPIATTFPQVERREVQSTADATAGEVRPLLPTEPHDLVFRVYAGKHVIQETGETIPPNAVIWTVEPSRIGGVAATVRTKLRAALFTSFTT